MRFGTEEGLALECPVIVKRFDTGHSYVVSPAEFSQTVPPNPFYHERPKWTKKITEDITHLDNLFKKLTLNPLSTYIMCPMYHTSAGMDFQICVTGNTKIDEKPITALSRELREEVGIAFSGGPKKLSSNSGFELYAYSMTRMVYNKRSKASCAPDAKLKVGAFVYGGRAEVEEYVDRSIVRPHTGSETEILKGVALIPWASVLWMLRQIGITPLKTVARRRRQKIF